MKVAIISPGSLPIPAILGGAIETLTTHIINQNEISHNYFEFVIFNHTNEKIKHGISNFTNTQFIEIDNNEFKAKSYNLFWRVLRILSLRRISHRTYFIKECIRIVNDTGFDVVLIEGNYTQIIQFSKSVSSKIILHLHTDILNKGTPLAKRITSSCDKIFAISEYIRKRIIEIDEENNEKTFILKNAIDVKKFDRDKYHEFREKFRREHGISKHVKIVMYCGRLSKEKGVHELILAYQKIQHLNCRLVIVGSSWFSSDETNKYTRELIKYGEQLSENIIFTGYVPHNNIPKYYAIADILVAPSIGNEAAGLVIIEALASGIPVITTNKGGIPEYASNESCEIVPVTNNFINDLAHAIAKMLNNYEYYLSKKNKARETVLEYNLESYYKNFKYLMEGSK